MIPAELNSETQINEILSYPKLVFKIDNKHRDQKHTPETHTHQHMNYLMYPWLDLGPQAIFHHNSELQLLTKIHFTVVIRVT